MKADTDEKWSIRIDLLDLTLREYTRLYNEHYYFGLTKAQADEMDEVIGTGSRGGLYNTFFTITEDDLQVKQESERTYSVWWNDVNLTEDHLYIPLRVAGRVINRYRDEHP